MNAPGKTGTRELVILIQYLVYFKQCNMPSRNPSSSIPFMMDEKSNGNP